MLPTTGGNNGDCTGAVPWDAKYGIISSGTPKNQDGNSVLGVLVPPISQEPIQSPSSQIHSLQSSSQSIREVNVPFGEGIQPFIVHSYTVLPVGSGQHITSQDACVGYPNVPGISTQPQGSPGQVHVSKL